MEFCLSSFLLQLLGIFTALIAVIFAYYKRNFQYWKSKNVPYIEGNIPFGSIGSPLTRTVEIGEIYAEFYNKARKNGWKHCGFYTFARHSYLVVDLEMVKNIMAKDFFHFTDKLTYCNEKSDPLNAHLFNVGGMKWKNLRAKLTPTFTSGKLKTMFQTLVDCGLVLQKYFDEIIDEKEPIDIKDVLGRFSTDIIGSCAFGIDCNSFKEPDSPFRVFGKKVFASHTNLDVLKITICEIFPRFAKALNLTIFSKPVSNFFYGMAEDMVEYREKNKVVRNDFMQLLIELKSKEKSSHSQQGDGTTLTMDELAAQSFVFFLAGFETSSTTMTFALYELAVNPDIQDRVREEIKTVLARHDNKMTYDSISELKYMRQVVDEILRMYPPLSILSRKCVEDYKVPGDDLIIEKGTRIVIPVKAIHYDEEFFENPTKFDPERFTAEKKRGMNKYSYLPFGEGPRICIGERFGIMQTKVGITSILQKFRVKLNKKTQVPLKKAVNTFITTIEGDIWLDLESI